MAKPANRTRPPVEGSGMTLQPQPESIASPVEAPDSTNAAPVELLNGTSAEQQNSAQTTTSPTVPQPSDEGESELRSAPSAVGHTQTPAASPTSDTPPASAVTVPSPPPATSNAGMLQVVDRSTMPSAPASVGNDVSRTEHAPHAFEAIAIGPAPTIDVPQKPEKRTAHLGFRVTESYLSTFKRRTLYLAAYWSMSAEEVNLFILQEMGDMFGRVDARIQRHVAAVAEAERARQEEQNSKTQQGGQW